MEAVGVCRYADGVELAYVLVLACDGGALGVACGERIDRIRLSTACCRFGGVRWWAHCPRCQRRRAVLWGDDGAGGYACRACYGLAYTSSQLSKVNRFERKLHQLAHQLEVSGDCMPYQRPRGMRRRKYAFLCGELREAKRRTVMHMRRSMKGLAATCLCVERARSINLRW